MFLSSADKSTKKRKLEPETNPMKEDIVEHGITYFIGTRAVYKTFIKKILSC